MISKFLLASLISVSLSIFNAEDSVSQQNPLDQTSLEHKIGYKKGLLTNKLDYQLIPTNKRKFVLKITNSKQDNFNVKIYDVIGNLILSEDLTQDQNGEKEYDFSDRNTKIFVVKVDAGEENLTKKVTI